MKALVKSSLVVAGACAVALSGSVYAFASWNTTAPPVQLVIKTAAMPQGNAPSVEKTGKNATLRWVPNRIVPGVRVQSYIVTRVGQGDPVVVCDEVTTASCRDKLVPAGKWTWTVRPVLETWQGEDSPASLPLEFMESPQSAAAAKGTVAAAGNTASAPDGTAEPHTDVEPDTDVEQPAGTPAAPTAAANSPTEDELTTAPPTTAPASPTTEPIGSSTETAQR